MEYLKERTFELFRYTLPGMFLISIILLVDERINNPLRIYDFYFKGVSVEFFLGLVIFGFILGLIIDQFSGIPLRKLIKKRTEPEYISKSNLTTPQKYVLVREISPANFRHIENWNVYKGMCDNLSFDFLILTVISIYKTITSGEKIIWIFLIIISVISIMSLLSSARRFKQWARQDIDSTIDMIKELKENKYDA